MDKDQKRVQNLLLDAAEKAKRVAEDIRKANRTSYSEKWIKSINAELVAINAQHNSAGKAVVAEAVFNKVQVLADATGKKVLTA